ncbi:unnamed protein product [Miscanthus lutarioriparius]|uniref:Uncharacterized protein n=1 Tax=Miscanthus lutarioriparius TaxID=422564 RepID=A0A811RYH7_9POAL|nr:unnamed protein product [Miscanthus lutarioriparius]
MAKELIILDEESFQDFGKESGKEADDNLVCPTCILAQKETKEMVKKIAYLEGRLKKEEENVASLINEVNVAVDRNLKLEEELQEAKQKIYAHGNALLDARLELSKKSAKK